MSDSDRDSDGDSDIGDDLAALSDSFQYTLNPPVRVIVGKGEEQETHYVHPALLRSKSEFFRGCLQEGHFVEAAIREVQLFDEKPAAFRFFLKWLYTGDLAPFPAGRCVKSIRHLAIDVYILADRLLCSELKDRAMDMVQECCQKSWIDLDNLNQVIQCGLTSSTLWKYMVRQVAADMRSEGFRHFTEKEGWPASAESGSSFVTELLEDLKDSTQEDPAFPEDCTWHEHSKESNCNGERWPRVSSQVSS